jgi:hypothetical protein
VYAGAVNSRSEIVRATLFASSLMPSLGQQLSVFVSPHFFSALFDHTAQTITPLQHPQNSLA